MRNGKKYFKKTEFDIKYTHNKQIKKILLLILRGLYDLDNNVLKELKLYKNILNSTDLKDKIAIKIIEGLREKYKDEVIDICNYIYFNYDKIFLYDLKGKNEYSIKFTEK